MADDMLTQVLKLAHASEGSELRFFRVARKNRELLVTVLDAGPSTGPHRFHVEVQDAEDPPSTRYSLSNPGATLEEALWGVHWKSSTKSSLRPFAKSSLWPP
jgi:hypothetical protein